MAEHEPRRYTPSMSTTTKDRAAAMAELYEEDFYAWTQAQADALRRLDAAAVGLDLANLIEEVEGLGRSQRDAVRSQLRRIIEHCLKLEWSRADRPRGGWQASIVDARAVLRDKLSASLMRDLEDRLPILHGDARRGAAIGLRDHGEPDAADALPDTCPYTLEQLLLDDWYPPSRHGQGQTSTPS
jgi:hypothetical protein